MFFINILFWISLFWIAYGLAGLFGFQFVRAAYRGHAWSKGYIRGLGLSWVLLGVPFLILALATDGLCLKTSYLLLYFALCAAPSLLFTAVHEYRYRARQKAATAPPSGDPS